MSILSSVSSVVCHHHPNPPWWAVPPVNDLSAAPVADSPGGCAETSTNIEGSPIPQNDWSPMRVIRLRCRSWPVTSLMHRAASAHVSAIVKASLSSVAPMPPVESTLRWSTACRYRSSQWVSAYHVEPEYRPCEWPDQNANRTPRRSRF